MASVTGAAHCGEFPQVTIGAMALPFTVCSVSNVASSSDGSSRQKSTALSHAAPFGAYGRLSIYSSVVLSGATMPIREPASMVILHNVSRPSIERSRMADPAYSMACPVPPAALIWRMIAMMTSLPETPKPSLPSTVIRMVFGRRCQMACVARTCATSDAPIPKEMQPRAPCVEVWLSPQQRTIPGSVIPCSGPTTCAIPCRSSSQGNNVTPNSSQFSSIAIEISVARGSGTSRKSADFVGV